MIVATNSAPGALLRQPQTADTIVASWSQQTRTAVKGRHVLGLQDTSEIHFTTQARRRRRLGRCGHGNAYGLLAHTMIAVDADSHACLGLVGGKVWNRKKTVTTPLRKRELADRESRRWVETAEAAQEHRQSSVARHRALPRRHDR